MPGQQETGNAVNLGGTSLSMAAFLLRGPYISWRGFLCVLRDFNIASLPSIRTKLGKLFPRDLWGSGFIPGLVTAPLSMQEAASIFIECSKTGYPTVCLHQHLRDYQEVKASITLDPYREVSYKIGLIHTR